MFDKAAPSPSETSASCPGCLKSFWLVNTRCLPTVGCCSSAPFTPQVAICTCGQGCAPATLDDLLAEDSSDWFTVFFVHGNLTSYQDSIDLGHQLRAQLPERVCSGQPVRLIVWTWPSDSDVGRLRDDTALAGSRAATESYYLGRFATMLHVDQRMLVIGYSFGARITTGTLHLLAGCPLGGRHLADQHAPSNDLQAPRMRAVLLAAAIDVDWLIPGHFHGAAMVPVERMAITINPRDLALKKYRMAEKRNAPEPIGKVGPPLNAMGSGAAKIVTTNVASELGIRHGSPYYFASGQVMNLIRGEL
ncbi:MAG: alpha/beta hydrolase, partial [Planctomycetaceae bacterium]|nr:alpha/beta hydrolase [Planctomycetaceae bacterium]